MAQPRKVLSFLQDAIPKQEDTTMLFLFKLIGGRVSPFKVVFTQLGCEVKP